MWYDKCLRDKIAELCAHRGFRHWRIYQWNTVQSLQKTGRLPCFSKNLPETPPADSAVPLDVVILPFVLHTMEEGAYVPFLRAVGKSAPHLVILDYRQPERNLDFPAFWLASLYEGLGTHGARYRAFMRRGGIEIVLREAGLVPLHREPVRGGAASLILCKASETSLSF